MSNYVTYATHSATKMTFIVKVDGNGNASTDRESEKVKGLLDEISKQNRIAPGTYAVLAVKESHFGKDTYRVEMLSECSPDTISFDITDANQLGYLKSNMKEEYLDTVSLEKSPSIETAAGANDRLLKSSKDKAWKKAISREGVSPSKEFVNTSLTRSIQIDSKGNAEIIDFSGDVTNHSGITPGTHLSDILLDLDNGSRSMVSSSELSTARNKMGIYQGSAVSAHITLQLSAWVDMVNGIKTVFGEVYLIGGKLATPKADDIQLITCSDSEHSNDDSLSYFLNQIHVKSKGGLINQEDLKGIALKASTLLKMSPALSYQGGKTTGLFRVAYGIIIKDNVLGTLGSPKFIGIYKREEGIEGMGSSVMSEAVRKVHAFDKLLYYKDMSFKTLKAVSLQSGSPIRVDMGSNNVPVGGYTFVVLMDVALVGDKNVVPTEYGTSNPLTNYNLGSGVVASSSHFSSDVSTDPLPAGKKAVGIHALLSQEKFKESAKKLESGTVDGWEDFAKDMQSDSRDARLVEVPGEVSTLTLAHVRGILITYRYTVKSTGKSLVMAKMAPASEISKYSDYFIPEITEMRPPVNESLTSYNGYLNDSAFRHLENIKVPISKDGASWKKFVEEIKVFLDNNFKIPTGV